MKKFIKLLIIIMLTATALSAQTYNKIKKHEGRNTTRQELCYIDSPANGVTTVTFTLKEKKIRTIGQIFDPSVPPPPPLIDYVNTKVIYLNGNQAWRENIIILTDGYTIQDSALARSNGTTLFNYFKTSEFWKEYWQNYNWVIIASPSPTSGINTVNPPYTNSCVSQGYPAITDKTPLYGSVFNFGGLCRLLYATNTANIQQVVNNYFPSGVKQTMVLANSPYYGGSGGTYATGSTNYQSSLIMRHEVGHSYAKLADEYEGYATFRNPPPSGGYYYKAWNSGDNSKPNIDTGRTFNRSKYKLYMNPSLPFKWWPNSSGGSGTNEPTAFEGAAYYSSAAANNFNYGVNNGANPTAMRFNGNSFMQSLNISVNGVTIECPLYAINYEAHIYQHYLTIPTSKWLSAFTSTTDTVFYPSYPTATQQLTSPKLKAEWKVNGVVVSNLATYNFPTGKYSITYTLRDTSWQTRNLQGNSLAVYNNYTMPVLTKTWNYSRSGGVTVTLSPFTPVCVGSNPVTLTGGSPSGGVYSGTNVSGGLFNPVTAGTTTITYTYNGSSATQPFVVNSKPIVSVSGTSNICSGLSTTLTASGAISYVWSTSATVSAITVSPVVTTTYTVIGTNANSCTSSVSFAVTVVPNVTASISGVSSICSGSSTTYTASGGTSYAWSTGATTQSINITTANTYNVTVTNASGCTGLATKTLSINALPTVVITPSGATTFCSGSSVNLVASGGTTYLWSTTATTPTINVTTSGTYSVTVTNASGCTGSTSQAVTVNSIPSATITPSGSTTFCSGGNVDLIAGGGVSYLWSTSQVTTSINASTTGTYTVTVTNANGCTSTASQNVVANSIPSAAISGVVSICSGESTTYTGPASLNYSWSTGATTQSISITSANIYSLTTTSADGCTASSSKTLAVYAQPTPTASSNTPICSGGSLNLYVVPSAAVYSWSGPNSFTASTQNPTISNAQGVNNGTYSVTITDANGCTGSSSINAIVQSSSNVTASNAISCSSTLTVSIANPSATSYSWSPTTYVTPTGGSILAGSSIVPTFRLATTKRVYVLTTTANGCIDRDTIFTQRIVTPSSGLTTNITTSTATITWSNSGDTQQYFVRYRRTGFSTWTLVTVNNTNTLNLIGLTAGVQYEWQVRARCNSTGTAVWTSFSKYFYFTTQP